MWVVPKMDRARPNSIDHTNYVKSSKYHLKFTSALEKNGAEVYVFKSFLTLTLQVFAMMIKIMFLQKYPNKLFFLLTLCSSKEKTRNPYTSLSCTSVCLSVFFPSASKYSLHLVNLSRISWNNIKKGSVTKVMTWRSISHELITHCILERLICKYLVKCELLPLDSREYRLHPWFFLLRIYKLWKPLSLR